MQATEEMQEMQAAEHAEWQDSAGNNYSTNRNRFYAVKKGRQAGVFDTWEIARKRVDGYSGAVFQSFKTEGEALTWMMGKDSAADLPQHEELGRSQSKSLSK